MPELPEVHTVVSTLKPVVSEKIVSFIYSSQGRPPNASAQDLNGKRILEVNRYGKYILFVFEDGHLVSHLRMTGQWFVSTTPPGPDVKFRWALSLGEPGNVSKYAWFCDVRQFGTLDWVPDLTSYKPVSTLGPDGLDLQREAAIAHVEKKLAKSSKPIKNLLMDQTVIAGPGNIYVSEILWALKINPESPAKEHASKAADICVLFNKIFLDAIEHGGCSISDYIGGKYHEKLWAYGKEGKPCKRCETSIVKIVQAGRSTYLCPTCQV